MHFVSYHRCQVDMLEILMKQGQYFCLCSVGFEQRQSIMLLTSTPGITLSLWQTTATLSNIWYSLNRILRGDRTFKIHFIMCGTTPMRSGKWIMQLSYITVEILRLQTDQNAEKTYYYIGRALGSHKSHGLPWCVPPRPKRLGNYLWKCL